MLITIVLNFEWFISYKMRDSVANAGLTYISLYHFLSKTDVHNFDQGKFLINFKVSWGVGGCQQTIRQIYPYYLDMIFLAI